MKKASCGCNETESALAAEAVINDDLTQLATPVECPATVHETVCVQAQVTITPNVMVGEMESFCVGGPVIGTCPGTPSPTESCSFIVSQNICVQIPLTFSANAVAEPTGIICGTPAVGQCVV